MATDVDLSNTTLVNISLPNRTINSINSSVQNSSGTLENTIQVFTTEAWVQSFGTKEEQWGWLATVVLLLATLLANGALLGVTWKSQRLHSSLYGLLASLASAHTLNALLVLPIAINAAIYDEIEVSWSVCVAWMCLTQFIMSVVLIHLGLAILHCLVLLLSPLWYRQCTGIMYPCLLIASAWVLPLLLIIPGASVLNTSDRTNCAQSLSAETIIALHIPTYYGPAITVAVIYTIVAYITQNKSRMTNQLQHEGVENEMAGNKITRDRWSSELSNHSSMATYNSETPSICSDNASVHSIPSIDIDDGSAVAISLPNGRNGFVHLNQAPPDGKFIQNGDVNAADHIPNGHIPNGSAETPRRLVTNGSAVCLPDTISPATKEDDKKKQRPRDVQKQTSADSDSMQLEIHKVDVDDGRNENDTGDTQNNSDSVEDNNSETDTENNDSDPKEEQGGALQTDNSIQYVKESVNRKLSAISERDDSSSLSVKSDDSASVKDTPTHTAEPVDLDTGGLVDADEESSLTTCSTGSTDTQSNRPADAQSDEETPIDSNSDVTVDNPVVVTDNDKETGEVLTTPTDDSDSPTAKPKSGKEQLNVPLDDTDIEISIETDQLVTNNNTPNGKGVDNFGFTLNDGEELSLSDSIKVKHKQPEAESKENQQGTEELLKKDGEQPKDNGSSDGTQSGGHSRNSSQGGGGISGPRRSILRRDKSKRQSTKSVKFDIPDSQEQNKPKRLHRRATGKVPRNQQLKKKGSKGSVKGNAATSKRRRTLVKQQAQSTEEPPGKPTIPVTNGIISSVAPYATRPPLLSSSSSFGYMAAVQSSQAERLNHRIKAQQVNVNMLFVAFLLYIILTGPHIVLAIVRSLCSTCDITAEARMSLQWLMYSASLILPVVLLCFLPEYKSAIRDPDAKRGASTKGGNV